MSRLFVVAFDASSNQGALHALDLATGHEAASWSPLALFNQSAVYNYGALTLYNGRVLVPVGGHACDQGDYMGAVYSVNISDGSVETFWTQPPGSGYSRAGVWGTDGIVVAAEDGVDYLWLTTGNGGDSKNEWDGYAEKILKVQLSNLVVNAMVGPAGLLNDYPDGDLGSTPTVFTPTGGCGSMLVAAQHKAAILLLAFATNLSSIGMYQLADFGGCDDYNLGACSGEFITSAVYDPSLNTLYVTATATPLWGDPQYLNATAFPNVTLGLQAFAVTPACQLALRWSQPYSLVTPPVEVPFTTPVSSNGECLQELGDVCLC